MRNVILWSLVLPVLLASECAPTDPPGNETPDDGVDRTLEIEPNDSIETATPVTFDESGQARLQGSISPQDDTADTDFYAMGPTDAGDRIVVAVTTSDSELNAGAAVYDAEGKLFQLCTAEGADVSCDEVFRHQSDNYYLVVSRESFLDTSSGSYEIDVSIERGGEIPVPRPQTVLLDFRGTSTTIPNIGPVTVTPFDAGGIDPVYAGQTAIVKQAIVATVEQDFARFDMTILNSDEDSLSTDEPHSTVWFGGFDPAGLGIALTGTDFYNADPSDDAVVFTGRFTPDLFTHAPNAEQLGVAIGNITAHEIGHLLGLSHVNESAALMNGYDAPDHLLTDQRFQSDSLAFSVFPGLDFRLQQDAFLLLQETVGRSDTAHDALATVGSEPTSLAAGDFDGDGDTDLAVVNAFSSDVWLLWNDGEAHFGTGNVLTMSTGPTAVVAADLDGDGLEDLATADLYADSVSILINQGGGEFASPLSFPVGDAPLALAAADFDGDTLPDLAVANAFSDNVSMLLNQGDGTFGPNIAVTETAWPEAVAVGDLDGDGDQDIVVADSGTLDVFGGALMLVNQGEATFSDPVSLVGNGLPLALAVVDVSQDGHLDVIVADLFADGVLVLINDGSGGFGAPTTWPTGDSPHDVATGDLDGDGDRDLIVANADLGDVSVLLNRGDGTFEPQWPYRVGEEPRAVVAADFDGDNDADLAVANRGDDTISILLNRGDGTFRRP